LSSSSSSSSPFRHGILCGGPVRARVGKVGLASAAGQPVPGTPVGGLTVGRYTLLDLLRRHGVLLSGRRGTCVFRSRISRSFPLFISSPFSLPTIRRIRFLIDRHVHKCYASRLSVIIYVYIYIYIYDVGTYRITYTWYTQSSLYNTRARL